MRDSGASSASRRRRAAARAGRKPSKQKRSQGRPEAESAAIAAQGPGTGETVMPASSAARHEQVARIADERRAGVGTSAMLSPPCRRRDELGDARALVVLVQETSGRSRPEFAQQAPAVARVLGGDRADTRENLARTRRNVAHVADRRRDDVEHARLQPL